MSCFLETKQVHSQTGSENTTPNIVTPQDKKGTLRLYWSFKRSVQNGIQKQVYFGAFFLSQPTCSLITTHILPKLLEVPVYMLTSICPRIAT